MGTSSNSRFRYPLVYKIFLFAWALFCTMGSFSVFTVLGSSFVWTFAEYAFLAIVVMFWLITIYMFFEYFSVIRIDPEGISKHFPFWKKSISWKDVKEIKVKPRRGPKIKIISTSGKAIGISVFIRDYKELLQLIESHHPINA